MRPTQGKCNIDAPNPTCNHCSVWTTNHPYELATEIWNKTISAVKIHAIARANHMNMTLTLRCTTVIEFSITIYAVSLPCEKRPQDVLRALCDQSITRKRMQCHLKEIAARASKCNKLERGQALPARARPHAMHGSCNASWCVSKVN